MAKDKDTKVISAQQTKAPYGATPLTKVPPKTTPRNGK